jgi:dCTP deaminase
MNDTGEMSGIGALSPKSSIGRTDTFVRTVIEGHSGYNEIPPGYKGPVWLEITPLSFNVGIRAGLSLIQGRFKHEAMRSLSRDELIDLHRREGIAFDQQGSPLEYNKLDIRGDGLFFFHIDLKREIVGFRARKHVLDHRHIDLTRKEVYDPADFWEPIYRPAGGELVLEKEDFFLLATQERIRIPSSCCAQMLPENESNGEMRAHYAGFFDPQFGGDNGTTGVLEVRARDVAPRIVHGQPVCAMQFEPLLELPDKVYGGDAGSNYIGSGPSISKHFSNRYEAWTKAYWKDVIDRAP